MISMHSDFFLFGLNTKRYNILNLFLLKTGINEIGIADSKYVKFDFYSLSFNLG